MRIRDYFPLGIASGGAFCNRVEETTLLENNIKNGKHTLIIATRRYGKSSLALEALKLSRVPCSEIDFFMASNEKMVESYLLNGIVDLIGKALGPVEKLTVSIKKYIKNLKPKLNIGSDKLRLELSTEQASDPAMNVKEGLMLLEKLLEEEKKSAVLLLDEFQTVGSIAQGKGIEAAIRHVAQKTKYLTLIFSGSHRKMLSTMFEDENRPLYKLCWKLSLSRISAEHYKKHIQRAANVFWKKTMADDAVDEILALTERHPYYVNKLCDRLWAYYGEKLPTNENVKTTWQRIVSEEKSDIVKDISLLSPGQKTVLLQMATYPDRPLTGKQSMLDMEMTSSSVITALEGLEEKDVIERQENRYQIINPVMKYYVVQ